MFDIGFSELLLVFVIGLLVLGPERLPKAARTLGFWMGKAKSTFNNLRNELEREALNQEMRERMEKEMREMGLDEDSIRQARDSLLSPEDTARARQRDDERDRRHEDEQGGRVIDHHDTNRIADTREHAPTDTTDSEHADPAPSATAGTDHADKGDRPEKHHDA